MDSAAKSHSNRLAFTVAKRVASLLIPIGFGLGDFISAAKAAFVEAAAEHIKHRGGRPSTARIAVLTGLTRAEVARVRGVGIAPPPTFATQRTERVMHGWFTDPAFVSAHGLPRRLQMTGPGSFESLVQRYSGDIPRRALLEELLAGGMVRVTTDDQVEAIRSHYLASAENESNDLDQLTRDVAVFFAGRSSETHESSPIIRRVSVTFPSGIPTSVRKTIELRTERFLEALSDYLHSHVPLTDSRSIKPEDSAPTLHVMIVQSELDSPHR